MRFLGAIVFCVAAGLAAKATEHDTTNHWSFQPVLRPAVPGARIAHQAARNPIDSFVAAKLAENQLEPSPEADRQTLIRRLYFDLIGLPPTPEEVIAFLRDSRAGAYDELVDRLLASPRFGERWARHWLDVVRFAESHGFEMNQPRPNAWPYRDYVIRAFNEDKPYDRFILEQIAGDALGAGEATGFLVAGAWDQVKSPDEVLTRNQRADELHDIVSTTATAFLGLTVGCARCHDHKFDPIPQRDYYAIKAVFEGVNHGERERRVENAAARARAADEAQARLLEVEAELRPFEPIAQTDPGIDTNRLRAPVHPRMNVERFLPVATKRLRFTIHATTDAEPCIDELEVYAAAPERRPADARGDKAQRDPGDPATAGLSGASAGRQLALRNVALASTGVRCSASGTFSNSDIHKLEHVNDGRVGNSRSWISNEKGKGWIELEFPETVTIHRVVWGRDREEKFKDRLATDYRIETAGGEGVWRLVASSADRRPFEAGGPFIRDFATNDLDERQLALLMALVSEQKALEDNLTKLQTKPMVYAGEFKSPEPTRRFHRGDPMQPREAVGPAALTHIALARTVTTDFSRWSEQAVEAFRNDGCLVTSSATAEQGWRLALARWLASPENPLTARVMVNRLWQYHFGEGLVSTPSDFGRNGAKPTHPELLDWLAAELVERGWGLKHIHRLIVTSATYRQCSSSDAAGVTLHDNRLLWRFPSRRLEAEPLRDSILAVAGELDLRMGGPGWSPFEPNDNYVRVYAPKQEFGPDDFRRMIYATVVRQRPDGVFGAFDCPDGGQIAPKRTHSTTPLQALNLLNSGFMMQAAGLFAERLEREMGNSVNAQVQRGFALAFQREASAEEIKASTGLIREQGLKIFCRGLLNANEFVYVY